MGGALSVDVHRDPDLNRAAPTGCLREEWTAAVTRADARGIAGRGNSTDLSLGEERWGVERTPAPPLHDRSRRLQRFGREPLGERGESPAGHRGWKAGFQELHLRGAGQADRRDRDRPGEDQQRSVSLVELACEAGIDDHPHHPGDGRTREERIDGAGDDAIARRFEADSSAEVLGTVTGGQDQAWRHDGATALIGVGALDVDHIGKRGEAADVSGAPTDDRGVGAGRRTVTGRGALGLVQVGRGARRVREGSVCVGGGAGCEGRGAQQRSQQPGDSPRAHEYIFIGLVELVPEPRTRARGKGAGLHRQHSASRLIPA